MGLLSWLAFEGGISKQIPSHLLCGDIQNLLGVGAAGTTHTGSQVLQGVPVCSLTALAQEPVQGSWSLGLAFGFVIPILSLNAGRVAPRAGRRPACSRSPAPGVWIRQKALELVTKVWMWAGKYSPVS